MERSKQLFGVAAAVYDGDSGWELSTSVVSGNDKNNVTLRSHRADAFDPADEASTMRVFEIWTNVVLETAERQRTVTKHELMSVFGSRHVPELVAIARPVAEDARRRHAEQLANVRIEARTEEVSETVRAFRSLCESVIARVAALQVQRPGARVQHNFREFMGDPRSEDGRAPRNLTPEAAMIVRYAEAGNRACLERLRELVYCEGRVYGETLKGRGAREQRFIQCLGSKEDAMYKLIRTLDLRQDFVRGIRDVKDWRHNMCVKVPGDPKSKPFTDVAVTYLADQFDEETGDGPSAVMLRH